MLEYSLIAAVPNAICVSLALAMMLKVRRKAPSEHRRSLLLLFIFMACIATIWCVERTISDPDLYMSMVVVEYIGSVCTVMCVVCFALQYAGYGHIVTRRNVTILAILGAIVVIINATNPWHHLFYETIEIKEAYGLYMMQAEYGPLFMIWMVYCVGLLIITMAILLRASLDTSGTKRLGMILIVVGIGIYTASGTLFAMVDRDPRLDMLSIGLSIAAILVYHADKMSSIIDQYSISIREAIRAMDDGVIILDPHGRIAYANGIATDLMNVSELSSLVGSEMKNDTDLKLRTGPAEREYGIKRSSIRRRESAIGEVIVLRDITERKVLERQLSSMNHRLDTITKMLRHDIKNDLVVLNEYLDSMPSLADNGKLTEKVQRSKRVVERLNESLEIVKENQFNISPEPEWQDIRYAIQKGIGERDLGGVVLRNEVDGSRVMADILFPLVFYNLMDNTLRHGMRASAISVRLEERNGGAQIIWEDDGVGIPSEEKEKIFDKGFGRHTGQGLFFIKDILRMTGIDIIEDGTPGEGARFVITVPANAFHKNN